MNKEQHEFRMINKQISAIALALKSRKHRDIANRPVNQERLKECIERRNELFATYTGK
jgi:hypothetical protein